MTSHNGKLDTPTRIAVRHTYDGKRVELWSDGVVILGNGKFGYSRSRKIGLEAGWLVMGDVCIYTQDEVLPLCAAAKRAVADKTGRLGRNPTGRMRARMRAG